MQLRTNISLLSCVLLGAVSAGEWRTESAGFEFNPALGRGKFHGPVKLSMGKWSFASAREALVTSKATIVKQTNGGAGRGYQLNKESSTVVFLGNAVVEDAEGVKRLEAPFLILSMKDMTVTATGVGIVVRCDQTTSTSSGEKSSVTLDLRSGAVELIGSGW